MVPYKEAAREQAGELVRFGAEAAAAYTGVDGAIGVIREAGEVAETVKAVAGAAEAGAKEAERRAAANGNKNAVKTLGNIGKLAGRLKKVSTTVNNIAKGRVFGRKGNKLVKNMLDGEEEEGGEDVEE